MFGVQSLCTLGAALSCATPLELYEAVQLLPVAVICQFVVHSIDCLEPITIFISPNLAIAPAASVPLLQERENWRRALAACMRKKSWPRWSMAPNNADGAGRHHKWACAHGRFRREEGPV
jgi:hypothetical protein